MTLLVIVIGAVLVNRLRVLFKENYFEHSKTIVQSIILQVFGALFMLGYYILEPFLHNQMDDLKKRSILS